MPMINIAFYHLHTYLVIHENICLKYQIYLHPHPLRNLSETDDVLEEVALGQKSRGFNESTGVGPIVNVAEEVS